MVHNWAKGIKAIVIPPSFSHWSNTRPNQACNAEIWTVYRDKTHIELFHIELEILYIRLQILNESFELTPIIIMAAITLLEDNDQ